MDIEEMHVTFREMAQQMGMQTTRAILMEDIDICINATIISKIRDILTENVGPIPYNNKIARQNAVISPINALRTLYRKNSIPKARINGTGTEVDPYKVSISDNNVMLYTGFKVSYNGKTVYDCRLIEAEDLGQTLRDFCNRAAKDAPICVAYGDEDSIDLDIYTGRITVPKPELIQYLYIANPAKVHYEEDDVSARVDCDLPSYLHMEIVTRAVNIYLASIGATSSGSKQES